MTQRVVLAALYDVLPRMAAVRWGPDDGELVFRAITEQSLCVPCIGARTGVTRDRVNAVLGALGEALTIICDVAPCEACGLSKEVFRLL